MKFQLRKNLLLLAITCSVSIGAHAVTQTDIANWTRSAKSGNVNDQYNLGLAYGKGEGIAANFAESFKWFKVAADNGHPESMYFVGGFYLSGTGVERNPLESEKWMLKAAQQGNKDAQKALVSFYRDGAAVPDVPRNTGKAKFWQGVIEGRISLALPVEVASAPAVSRFGGELVTDANLPPNIARTVDYLNSRLKDTKFFLKGAYLIASKKDGNAFAFPLNATEFHEYTEHNPFGADFTIIGFQCFSNTNCITTSHPYYGEYKLEYSPKFNIERVISDRADDGIFNAIGLLSSYAKKQFGKWVPKYQTDEFGGSRKLLNPANIQGWSEPSIKSEPDSREH